MMTKNEAMKRTDETVAPMTYSYLEIKVLDATGTVENEKFFEGRLPKIGEAVEMIYAGSHDDGATMRFKLKVREP